MLLLNPRRTRTNMKLLQLVWIFLLTLCGQSGITAMMVKEDDDVILDCSFGRNIENGAFDWKKDVDQSNEDVFWYSGGQTDPGKEFKDRVFHFPDQLRFGNASIKIEKAKTSDSGTYTCYHATVKKEIKSNISLTVGASPKPFITILKETQNSALLHCVVQNAFPKPEVVWKDRNGEILDADEPKVTKGEENKYNTVLNVTVTKTDHYTCVATQKEIHHQINSTTFVRLNGGALQPWATILGENDDGVLLQCVVRGASPELNVSWKDKSGNLVPSKEPQKTENSIILKTTVKKTDYYICVTTEGKKDDELYSEIYVPVPDGPSWGLVIGIIAAVVVGLLAVVAVHCFHIKKKSAGDSTTDGSIEVNGVHSPLKQDV